MTQPPTPLVVVLDDALDPATFTLCREAITRRLPEMREQVACDGKIRFRRWQDYEAGDPILTSAILNCVFTEPIIRAANAEHDLSWRWFAAGFASTIDLQLTSYARGGQYIWHTDHLVRGRTHNFILYMTDAARFTGGQLQISYAAPCYSTAQSDSLEPDLVVNPQCNRLVLMPSHMLHRVTPVAQVVDPSDVWSTRLTINGHLRVPGLEGAVP